ncbi:MAG: hypothetical protein FWB80_12980 [Defluviitaleaceae bacterium]|nr:hypothetical protein [Defluviitaleaceae bacterium]
MKTKKTKPNLDELASRLDALYKRVIKNTGNIAMIRIKIFISLGERDKRADVVVGIGNTSELAYELAKTKAIIRANSTKLNAEWLKLDIVTFEDVISMSEFTELANKTRKFYFKYGISFDHDYKLAVLPHEINGAALIKYNETDKYTLKANERIDSLVGISWEQLPYTTKSEFDFKRFDARFRETRELPINSKLVKPQAFIIFSTTSAFCDGAEIHDIDEREICNMRRKIDANDPDAILDVINKNAEYLANSIKEDGEFFYGCFPTYNTVIKGYNAARHALGILGIADAYLTTKNESLLPPLKRAREYMITKMIHRVDERAYIVDWFNDEEIRLGAIGVAVIALCRCIEIFGKDEDGGKYAKIAQELGEGILHMQNAETGRFFHVWKYPDLGEVDEFRIVYYSGEAAFALMRLYWLDNNEKWVNSVKKAFDFFLKNDYWEHCDHWLAYCTNELTAVVDDDRYYEFGLKNAFHRLKFYETRITAYHTFLELLGAVCVMIKNIKERGKEKILTNYDIDRLYRVIPVRTDMQMNSIMFPETAMYFKSPQTVLNGVFVRHNVFNVRNDHVAHNLSGFCLLLNEMLRRNINA